MTANSNIQFNGMADAFTYYADREVLAHPLHGPKAQVDSPGKAPILRSWPTLTRPCRPNSIKKELNNGCNVGAVCGKVSNLTVIDIDYQIKGINEFIFDGIDCTSFVEQKRTNKNGKKHVLFQYNAELKTKQYQPLGFDVLNDSGNIVLAPSIHVDGDVYQLEKDIAVRPEMPEELVTRIKELAQLYEGLKKVLKKCRTPWRRFWNSIFEEKSSEHYRQTELFRGSDGRRRSLGLFSELKAQGASEEQLILACALIFEDDFDKSRSQKELKNINPQATWRTETIIADEYLSEFPLKESSVSNNQEEEQPKNNSSALPELTEEEILSRKECFKDRRLQLNLPADHFINIVLTWLTGITDGYPDYIIMGALWLISSFCNYNVQIKLKQETIRPNLVIMLIGKSTTSRKTTVINRIRTIFETVTNSYLPNENFSIEGYLESLSKEPKQHHVRDEAAGLIAYMHQRFNEGFNELECAIYDGQNFRKTLAAKGNKEQKVFEVRNPYVTKLYGTTLENYAKYTQVEDFLCGKEFRTLFAFPNYLKNRLPLGVETDVDRQHWLDVLDRASEIHFFVRDNSPVEMTFEPDALDYYSLITSFIEEAADKADNAVLSSAVGRGQIHILKLAMLLELGKTPINTTITNESIDAAARMVTHYFLPTLIDVFDRLQEDVKLNMVERVLSVIRRAGGAIQHTKALHDSKLKSRDFAEVIGTLIESETIESVTESKSKKIFYILKELKNNLDLSTYQQHPNSPNLFNLQNPPDLLISQGNNTKEILETLNNVTQLCCVSSDKDILQSNNSLSLQNLLHTSTLGDEETQEIREIKEIEEVKGSLVTEDEALKILEEEGL